jgi:hypothetical protein
VTLALCAETPFVPRHAGKSAERLASRRSYRSHITGCFTVCAGGQLPSYPSPAAREGECS